MELSAHGGSLALRGGAVILTARYTSADAGPGTVALELEDQESFDSVETRIQLAPWRADAFEVFEWRAADAIVLGGEPRVVLLDLADLHARAAVTLEYEEADTIPRPWTCECEDGSVLVMATERRIWCFDSRLAIRWMWSVGRHAEHQWMSGPPEAAGGQVRVSLRGLRRESTVTLSVADGREM